MNTISADTFNLAKPKTTFETKSLVPFLALTFGLTWGLAAILMLFPDQIVAIFGEVNQSEPAGHPGGLCARDRRRVAGAGGRRG